jgi:hypothetical protein
LDEEAQDLEGRIFAGDAGKCARSIMGSELTSRGEITLSHWIEIETEEGEMHVVTFGSLPQ